MARVAQHPAHTASPAPVGKVTMSSLTASPSVLIRAARGSDGPALHRLAALDSSRVPPGGRPVAGAGADIAAALAPNGGERIAAPFRRPGDVLAMLELRAAGPKAARRTPRLGLRPARLARAA